MAWPNRGGVARGREGAAKAVGARPGVVEAWPRAWGRGRGVAKTVVARSGAVGGVALTVGVRPGAVGAQLSLWGCSQEHRGMARGRGGAAKGMAKTVGARPRAVGLQPWP